MKRKHYGFLSVVFIMSAIVTTAVYAFLVSGNVKSETRFDRLKPLPHINIPDPTSIVLIQGFKKELFTLAQPKRNDLSPVNLRLFNYQPVDTTFVSKDGKKSMGNSQMKYSLSLAFSSGAKRFCVIDGIFYAEGALLPDGGKIVRIEPNRVLVKKQRFEEWAVIEEK